MKNPRMSDIEQIEERSCIRQMGQYNQFRQFSNFSNKQKNEEHLHLQCIVEYANLSILLVFTQA
jgi:hypothetical protein